MRVINKGGTLVYGDGQGGTIYLRTGETADVPDHVFEAHHDKLKDADEIEADFEKPAEVRTTQQRPSRLRGVEGQQRRQPQPSPPGGRGGKQQQQKDKEEE